MLIDLTDHLPAAFALLQAKTTAATTAAGAESGANLMQLAVRWLHFVAGIAWIGMLYFFNLVNVNFMKGLDAPTKKVVVPSLMPKALWYFRWGAVVTVLVGLMYYLMYIVPVEARAIGMERGTWLMLIVLWLVVVLVTYAILFYLYRVPALTKDGRVLAVVVAILSVVMSVAAVYVLNMRGVNCTDLGGGNQSCLYLGTKTLSIGIGGGLGLWMLLNVWGIIWPAQKRIIAATEAGTPPDAALARRAFLASRTNAWLSLPMLFFMAHSHDYFFPLGR